jgi:Anti-sigma-28 factor, FlgM
MTAASLGSKPQGPEGHVRLTKKQGSEEVSQLKQRVSLRTYEVDASRVADEMITKMRLLRRGRQALGGAGRSRSVNVRRLGGH